MANCPGALGFSCAPNVTQEPNVSPLNLLMPPSDLRLPTDPADAAE